MLKKFKNNYELCLHFDRKEYFKVCNHLTKIVRKIPLAEMPCVRFINDDVIVHIRTPFKFIGRLVVKSFNKNQNHGKIFLGERP